MATPKRGPLKIDLEGADGKRKIDAQWCPITGKYFVTINGVRYSWTATEFAAHFRRWLLRQRKST